MSDEARDLYRAFAERHGCTMSALLEAMARRLPPDEEVKATARQYETIEEARAIDAERRRRT